MEFSSYKIKMENTMINRIFLTNLVGVNYSQVKRYTFLLKNVSYNNILKRGMLSRLQTCGANLTQNLVVKTPTKILSRNMGVRTCVRFKPKSNAQKDLSSDDTGKHTHLLKELCEKMDCNIKKCPVICGNSQEFVTEGHMSHGPIGGKFSRFINDIDANGSDKSQYLTKNADKTKKASSQKVNNYMQKNEMKKDHKMENYCNKPEIKSKIDDE